ncbi:hypothetical protein DAETH_48160 (plasmid) [Deinococcus aetherius]|uniref:DUF3168 domain-containing protein n=1 Tax=Deinococcus aetherius TaxID=200252 RepID=A0ABM8AM66_9DEIO|nr:hypothetical protein [Deinococcus aetherius]BDP44847.1 hypothetical protein DAETH_48160 [Deinococcus aetherius]
MRQLTLPELREAVEWALADADVVLGTYRYPGGQETPALHVGDPPEGVTVRGLEILIPATPEPTVISTFAGAITIDHYPVRAVSHDGRTLTPVWQALATAFRGTPAPQVLQATDRYPDQMLVTITP